MSGSDQGAFAAWWERCGGKWCHIIAPTGGEPFDWLTTEWAEYARWDCLLTDDEVDALAAGADPRSIRPDKLRLYVPNHRAEEAT